ncbi:MAG: Bax inhibitor-1/YccA family protein [Candidatus Nanopelagicales bacterium]
MESRNPVLRRFTEQEESGQAGFAYDEGRSAYAAAAGAEAATAPTAEQLQGIYDTPGPGTGRLTLDDVIVKTGICFVILVIGAVAGWNLMDRMPLIVWGAALVGFVLAMVNVFKKQVSPPLILLYALVEGVFLGGISNLYNDLAVSNSYPGIVQQAVLGTLVAFGVMLALYKTRIIKVNGIFQKMMMVALVSYLVIGLASLVAALFGVGQGWGFYGVGMIGIVLCVFGVGLAAFSLALDFESITQAINHGAPERESWRLAFGLLVTLIWLYLEILRLLAILSNNR